MSTQQVTSPDGRTWTVNTGRVRRSLKETRSVPFFWAHVIISSLVILLIIWIFHVGWTGILSICLPAALVLWAIGFFANAGRTTIEATTPGPPPARGLWTVTKRFHTDDATSALTEAIKHGQYATEPPGTRLTQI